MEHYTFEGVAFRTLEQNTTTTSPVYRFFNIINGVTFLQQSETERDFCNGVG